MKTAPELSVCSFLHILRALRNFGDDECSRPSSSSTPAQTRIDPRGLLQSVLGTATQKIHHLLPTTKPSNKNNTVNAKAPN